MIERFNPFWRRVITGATILVWLCLLCLIAIPATSPPNYSDGVGFVIVIGAFTLVLVLAYWLLWPTSK
jgi:hypothetical protein